MKLAILFWFYKELEICKNRLEILRKHNPDVAIYGLYGGKHDAEKSFKDTLSPYLDDFYTSPLTDPEYKWLHGDLMILEWFESRGTNLSWDSIVIVQWDMLFMENVWKAFPTIQKDQIFLSGLKTLNKETEESWDWTRPGTPEREVFEKYVDSIRNEYQYSSPLLCCLFILEVIPRLFFEKFRTVSHKELGMLEYSIPNYAKIFNIPFFKKDMGVSWDDDSKVKPLNAIPEEIETEYIQNELAKPGGWRIFHPYFKIWDNA